MCETLNVEGLKDMCLEWRGYCPAFITDRFEDISALPTGPRVGKLGLLKPELMAQESFQAMGRE